MQNGATAGKVAVLTNNLQYYYVERDSERFESVDAFKPQFVAFLNRVRELGHYVFHLQQINDPNDESAKRDDGRIPCQKGTREAEIVAELLADSDVLIEKNKDSGFVESELDNELKARGIDTVIITGLQTQICVQTTAADAYFRGYNIWIPEDGVVSAREEDKVRALTWLENYCATIADAATIIDLLKSQRSLPRKELKAS